MIMNTITNIATTYNIVFERLLLSFFVLRLLCNIVYVENAIG